jgi:two-component system alkaline phosphatase synthesis response regulator PhoP
MSAGESKMILVADDEAHILHIVSLKLRNAGYDVITAMDGREAFELAASQVPDLIITDYQMPELTGLELCQELAANRTTKHIPIVMLTAKGFMLEDEEASLHNVRATLSKPFSPREVLTKIQELLEGEKAKQQAAEEACQAEEETDELPDFPQRLMH